MNGGVCLNGCPGYTCQCSSCWTGPDCTIRKYLKLSLVDKNKGNCICLVLRQKFFNCLCVHSHNHGHNLLFAYLSSSMNARPLSQKLLMEKMKKFKQVVSRNGSGEPLKKRL